MRPVPELFCSLLAASLLVAGSEVRAQTATTPPGTATVSDAAYAEVSALSYATLRQAATDLKNVLNNATSQDTPVVLFSREALDGQLALSSAILQLDNANERLCTLLRGSSQPQAAQPSGAARPEALNLGDLGTLLSGTASLAQLFTPHNSSTSIGLVPDSMALIADLIGTGRPLIVPDLYIASPSELVPDAATAQRPCGRTYLGTLATAPQDLPTLWLAAQTTAAQLRAARKPSDDLKTALAAYEDLAKSYLAIDPKSPESGTVYSQLLHAQALKRYLDPATKPVILILGIDAMGGTTSESGKTSFTSHVRYSAGVVVHYLAWQLSPDSPMKPVAAGTLTRTLSNQSESDIQTLLNH